MGITTPPSGGGLFPYKLARPPQSPGGALLATAFQRYCHLRWRLAPEEIERALLVEDGGGRAAERVLGAAALLGSVFARGWVRTWARPIGGGAPAELKPHLWELDDPTPRFATSAIDLRRPFESRVPVTHWIFVDLDGWTLLLDASTGAPTLRGRTSAAVARSVPLEEVTGAEVEGGPERFLRLPEVTRRTGLSRSTIYRRIQSGTFPAGTSLSGSITVWREGDVARWIRNPA